MPLYDYYCTKCIKTYEVLQSLKEHDKKVLCPICKRELKKHIGVIHLSSKRACYGY